MNKEILKKVINQIVEDSQGLKATELAMKFVIVCKERNMDIEAYDFVNLLQEIEDDKELVFVNYVIPAMTYREKQFVLPKGTNAIVQG